MRGSSCGSSGGGQNGCGLIVSVNGGEWNWKERVKEEGMLNKGATEMDKEIRSRRGYIGEGREWKEEVNS